MWIHKDLSSQGQSSTTSLLQQQLTVLNVAQLYILLIMRGNPVFVQMFPLVTFCCGSRHDEKHGGNTEEPELLDVTYFSSMSSSVWDGAGWTRVRDVTHGHIVIVVENAA